MDSGLLCGFFSLVVFWASSKAQTKNVHIQTSDLEQKNCSLLSLINSPGQTVYSFVGTTENLSRPQYVSTATLSEVVSGVQDTAQSSNATALCESKTLSNCRLVYTPEAPGCSLGAVLMSFLGYLHLESFCQVADAGSRFFSGCSGEGRLLTSSQFMAI